MHNSIGNRNELSQQQQQQRQRRQQQQRQQNIMQDPSTSQDAFVESESSQQQKPTITIKKVRSPKLILQQDICQKYGWSYTIERFPPLKEANTGGKDKSTEKKNEKCALKDDEVADTNLQEREEENVVQYICTVQINHQKQYRVISDISDSHVCELMIQELHQPLYEQQQKPIMTLPEYFVWSSTTTKMVSSSSKQKEQSHQRFIPIYDSHDIRNWEYFWNHKPTTVGIDTEGNSILPPILIQIAVIEERRTTATTATTNDGSSYTDDDDDENNNESSCYCIIEAPKRQRRNNNKNNPTATTAVVTISENLQRLLDDTSIVKVFCDNFSHRDKVALGITLPNNDVVDLEDQMNQLYGPVKSARGLANIVSLTIGTSVQISKTSTSTSTLKTTSNTQQQQQQQLPNNNNQRYKSVKNFVLLERGTIPPITNIFKDLSYDELQYAALDAYYTVRVYQYLQSLSYNVP